MTFLAPWMLLGGVAASIPLILHFFYRARYRPVEWGAMRFLRQAMEQTSRRLRFQEWILLLLRILVVLLLALALARPSSINFITGTGRGDAVDAIFVFDLSYSMNSREGSVTRLERAREAAMTVIDNLPPRSTVQVVTSADRAAAVGPKNPANLDQARELIRRLEPVQTAGDLLPGFTEAFGAFERCAGGMKEVYLFGDMQRIGWEKQASAIRGVAERIREQAGFYLVRCGDKPVRNAFIRDIITQVGIPNTGRRTAFTVLIKNTSPEALPRLEITLEVDGKPTDKDAFVVEKLAPGESRAVTLTAKFEQAGWRVLTARLKSDDLEDDNRFDRIIQVRDQVRVLVVDGAPNPRDPEAAGSFYLTNALVPVADATRKTWPIQPRVISAVDAGPGSLTDTEMCVLTNVAIDRLPKAFLDRLGEYVREGHGLWIVSGSNVNPADYNRVLGKDRADLLPLPLDRAVVVAKGQTVNPSPESADPQSFLYSFRENDFLRSISQGADLTTFQGVREPKPDEPQDGSRVLMRFNNGSPFLVSRRVGSGEVLFSSASFDREWGSLVLPPTFPPLVQGAVTYMLQQSGSADNRVAGEALTYRPTDPSINFEAVRPNGERIKLGKAQTDTDGRLSLSVRDTSHAGIWQIVPEGTDKGTPYAYVPDLRESESPETLPDTQIDDLLGFTPIHLSVASGATDFTGQERSRREWTVWVLLVLLLLTFGESIWAWMCGRTWGG